MLPQQVSGAIEALSASGVVLPLEVQAALDTSLRLKQQELAVQMFYFWGKITTTSGNDYYIARAWNGLKIVGGKPVNGPGDKYYYSQDGVAWLDLEPVSDEQVEKAKKLECWMSGDPANVFTVYEEQPIPEPEPVPEPAEGEEPPPPPEPVEAPPPLEFPVTEVEYLWVTIMDIQGAYGIMPEGFMLSNAAGEMIINPNYTGVKYPDQLSSFQIMGQSLDKLTPGAFGILYDSFKMTTIIRGLEYPGYFFYHNTFNKTIGALYFGNGLKNKDLAFCL